MKLFKKKVQVKSPSPPLEQENWGPIFQQAQLVSEGFRKVAELTNQFQAGVNQAFEKTLTLTAQYHNTAKALEKNYTTSYEQHNIIKENYKKLLYELAKFIDDYEQLTSNKEILQPIIDQIMKILISHGVTVYTPEENMPANIKYCVVEVPVPSEDKPPGIVTKVISKGYIWRDNALIPSKVAATAELVKPPQHDATPDKESDDSLSVKNKGETAIQSKDNNTEKMMLRRKGVDDSG
jgi:molecular chaperone GrpE (heat shock protein)